MAPPDRSRKSSGGAFQWPVRTRASAPVASVDSSVVAGDTRLHKADERASFKATASAEAHLAKLRTRKDSTGSIFPAGASRSTTPKRSRPASMMNLSTNQDHPVLNTESGMAVFPMSASCTSSSSAASILSSNANRRSVREPVEPNHPVSSPLAGSIPLSAKRVDGESSQNEAYNALRSIQSGKLSAPTKENVLYIQHHEERGSISQGHGTEPIDGGSAHSTASEIRATDASAAEALSTVVSNATQPTLAIQTLNMSATPAHTPSPEPGRHVTNKPIDSELWRRTSSRKTTTLRRRDGPTPIEAQIQRDSRAVIHASKKFKRVTTPSKGWIRNHREAEVNALLRSYRKQSSFFCSLSVQVSITAPGIPNLPGVLSHVHAAATKTRSISYPVGVPSALSVPVTWSVARASSFACLLISWAEKIM